MSRDPIPLHLPLDSEDFLRRACSDCGREFKQKMRNPPLTPPAEGFACPYCGTRAPEQDRYTQVQLDYANAVGLEHRAGAATPAKLTEPDDMVIWVLGCHDSQPLKVADDWDGTVGCLVCAQRT